MLSTVGTQAVFYSITTHFVTFISFSFPTSETNQLVLAALYGGLGQGIQSSKNFDYAKGLDPKIVSAGGYGLPTGIYSYAFDPSTGMPFMCDPTKTPPGGAKSQAAGVAAVNPPAATASKPKADDTSGIVPSGSVPSDKTSENVPSENTPSGNTPSGDTSTEIGGSVPSPDVHPSSTNPNEVTVASAPVTNTVGTNATPEHRLAPVTNTPPSHHKAQKDAPPVLNKTPDSSLENDETNDDEENNDDLMTSSSPSNDEDDTSISSEDNSASSPITNKITSPPSVTNPAKQLAGNNVQNRVSNHVKPSGKTSSKKEVQVKLGPPLYLPNPKINPQSSLQNKITNTRLTPLIDNYHKELMVPKGMKVKRSNSMKKYIESKKAAKKNGITIKLPTIPPCPDMKDYHWPWNCLGGSGFNL